MKRESLRPIAMAVLLTTLASVNYAAAASPAAGVVHSTVGTIEGRATDAAGKPVSNATVRLRNMQTGAIADTLVSNSTGQFAFQGVNPGPYMAELVGATGKAVAASPMVAAQAGKSVNTFISLPTMLSNAAGFVGAHAAVVAVVVASAAAAGVLAVQAQDCVSPPCAP